MKRAASILLLAAILASGPLALSLSAQTADSLAVPPDVREKVIDTYFRTNGIFNVLFSHYEPITITLIVMLVLTILLVRRYARQTFESQTRLFDAMKLDAVMLFDRDADLRLMNRSARQLLGLDEFVSMQHEYAHYFKLAPSKEIQEVFEQLKRTHHVAEREITFNQGKVLRTLVVKGYPVYSRSRKLDGFLLTMQDISEAIEKDRRVNWTGVAQHVAHQAKTPLSTITLTAQHLELLMEEENLPRGHQFSQYLNRIVNESKKLNNMVHSLTRLANKEQPNCQPYDVNAVLENILNEYRNKTSKNVQLLSNFNPTIPKGMLDIVHFPEAVKNLLENAVRAVGQNEGRIIVTTTKGQWIDRRGEYIEITISDTGSGMSDEIKKKIFRPFATDSQGGTGLGLVIVQKVIEEHNGEITFSSVLDVGTEFHIRIPVARN